MGARCRKKRTVSFRTSRNSFSLTMWHILIWSAARIFRHFNFNQRPQSHYEHHQIGFRRTFLVKDVKTLIFFNLSTFLLFCEKLRFDMLKNATSFQKMFQKYPTHAIFPYFKTKSTSRRDNKVTRILLTSQIESELKNINCFLYRLRQITLLVAFIQKLGNFPDEVLRPYRYLFIYHFYNSLYFFSSSIPSRSFISIPIIKNETRLFPTRPRNYRLLYFPFALASKWIISLILPLTVRAIVAALRNSLQSAANWTLATVRNVERPRENARTGLPSVSAACRSINCSKANQPGRWDLRNGESSNLGRNIRGVKSLRAISKRSSAALCFGRTRMLQVMASRHGINTPFCNYSVILSAAFSLYFPLYFPLTDREREREGMREYYFSDIFTWPWLEMR